VTHEDLKNADRGFDLLGQALVAHVDEELLAQLVEMGEHESDLARVSSVIGGALEQVHDGPLVRMLLRCRLELRSDRLNDPTGAGEDLKQLYDLSPADEQIGARLEGMYRDNDDMRGLVQLYEDQILRGRDQAVRGELARKVAHLWQDTLQEPREAADAWRRVLRMNSGDSEAKEGLTRAKLGMRKVSTSQIAAAEEETRKEVEARRKQEQEQASLREAEQLAKAEELKARHSRPPHSDSDEPSAPVVIPPLHVSAPTLSDLAEQASVPEARSVVDLQEATQASVEAAIQATRQTATVPPQAITEEDEEPPTVDRRSEEQTVVQSDTSTLSAASEAESEEGWSASEEELTQEAKIDEALIAQSRDVEPVGDEEPTQEVSLKAALIKSAQAEATTLSEDLGGKPPVEDASVVNVSVVETSAIQTPVIESPVVETPVVETPVVETPVVETPVVESVTEDLVDETDSDVEALRLEETPHFDETVVDSRDFVSEEEEGRSAQPAEISSSEPIEIKVSDLGDPTFAEAPAPSKAPPPPIRSAAPPPPSTGARMPPPPPTGAKSLPPPLSASKIPPPPGGAKLPPPPMGASKTPPPPAAGSRPPPPARAAGGPIPPPPAGRVAPPPPPPAGLSRPPPPPAAGALSKAPPGPPGRRPPPPPPPTRK
jgi:hypothetical protein